MSARPTISRIILRPLGVPLRQLYISSMYIMPVVERLAIEIETSDGGRGYGETYGSAEVLDSSVRMARRLLGRSPFDRLALRRLLAGPMIMSRNGRRDWAAFGGLELALFDWAGRHHDLALWQMLGGNGQETVEVVCPVPALILDKPVDRPALAALFNDHGRIKDVVGYCLERRRESGFTCFKYKSTGSNPAWDIAVLRALREQLGQTVKLRWDPNAAYPPAQASLITAELDELGLEFFEDPTAGIAGMASLRSRMRTRLATNMCVIQFDHLAAALRQPCVDVLLADISMWGGVQSIVELAELSPLLGFEVAIHSLFETGIGSAANLHLAAALGPIRRATDFGLHVLEAEVTMPSLLPVQAGRVRVPAGPGLGVMPEPESLRRYQTDEIAIAA